MRPALVGPAYSKRGGPTGWVTWGPAGPAPRWADAAGENARATRPREKRAIAVFTSVLYESEFAAYVYHAADQDYILQMRAQRLGTSIGRGLLAITATLAATAPGLSTQDRSILLQPDHPEMRRQAPV